MLPLLPLAIRVIVATVALGATFWGAKNITEHAEKKQWNKGVCTKCKGHFKLIEGTIGSLAKGYKCDVCDNCVWMSYGNDIGYVYEPSKGARKE